MKLKNNPTHYINIFLFTTFFFLWSFNLSPFIKKDFLSTTTFFKIDEFLNIHAPNFLLKYLILLLIFPIFLKLYKEKNFFSINKVFENQKYIIWAILFIVLHFFLTKFINNQTIEISEIFRLIFFGLLSIIFIHYRFFLKNYFEHILLFYLIIRIFSSYYIVENPNFFGGECNGNAADIYYYLNSNFNIAISNILFQENSHLSMMMIPVTLCNIFLITNSKKINFIYILLFILSTLIIFFNYSTTFYVGYIFSFIIIAIFFNKKISRKFWIFSFLFLLLNTAFFFGDKNCIKKITDLSVKDIIEKNINKTGSIREANISIKEEMNSKNLTTLIYERSAILTLDTFQHYPLGWGFDGMDNATTKLINKDRYSSKEIFIGDGSTRIFDLKNEVYDVSEGQFSVNLKTLDKSKQPDLNEDSIFGAGKRINTDFSLGLDENNKLKRITFMIAPESGDIIYVFKDIYIFSKILNLSDGLSNFFKILNEFGIFSLFILYFFIRYLLKIEKISVYNLFIITIFITMSIRGAGYFNGGFLFCLLEFFYIKKISDRTI